MDGNGRWASRQGMPRVMGHYRGAEVAEEITRVCLDLGVEYLSLFAFSTENWNRPKEEVNLLFELMRNYLSQRKKDLLDLGVRIRFIGRRDRIGKDLSRSGGRARSGSPHKNSRREKTVQLSPLAPCLHGTLLFGALLARVYKGGADPGDRGFLQTKEEVRKSSG